MKKITLIGAGLSGSFLATLLAKRGFDVTVYERRPDRRKEEVEAGRSINLAVSARGIHALKLAGLYEDIMAIATPMYGRMNHPLGGDVVGTKYSIHPENCLYSVSRGALNEMLMNVAEAAGAKILFKQECKDIDLGANEVYFADMSNGGETYKVAVNQVVACDGANSAVRRAMTRNTDFTHTEKRFRVDYKELSIPPKDGMIQMERNWLHIWGREGGAFMMIALPNMDNTFTCTLFMPIEGEKSLSNLDTNEKVQAFFAEYFPDAVPLMPTLQADFSKNPTSSLNIVTCFPWIIDDRMALVGDACHAVVPFYGQGVNASFEDCIELDECIGQHYPDWGKVFEVYQANRKANADAISQMAQENFDDMAKSGFPEFQLRKYLEHEMEIRFAFYKSQYETVSFSLEPYTEAKARGIRNQQILTEIIEDLPLVRELGLENALAAHSIADLAAQADWDNAENVAKRYYNV